MADSTLVKTAQVSAIVAAAAASGGIISISIFTIPSLLLKRAPSANTRTATTLAAPISHIARQWQYAYDIGKKLFPSMAVSLLYTAAGLNIMIAPFTLLAIVAVNNVIAPYTTGKHDLPVDAKEDAQYEQTEKEFVGQLEKWSLLNVIRGLFPLAGAGLGAAVTFGLLS
uniref:Noranthrone monooxygenase n=1 Tax=Talaromyces marneffei PM1 TaxID=1077442 RepID=A0A093V7E0_TALMA